MMRIFKERRISKLRNLGMIKIWRQMPKITKIKNLVMTKIMNLIKWMDMMNKAWDLRNLTKKSLIWAMETKNSRMYSMISEIRLNTQRRRNLSINSTNSINSNPKLIIRTKLTNKKNVSSNHRAKKIIEENESIIYAHYFLFI